MSAMDHYAFTNMNEMGSVSPPWEGTIALDVWRRVIDLNTGQETSQVKRERMRTLQEVYADLHDKLDVLFCEKCGHERKKTKDFWHGPCDVLGCVGEYTWFIDEYFAGPDLAADGGCKGDGLVPHNFRWIACYAVTGGSEGHCVHIDFMVPVEQVRIPDGDFNSKVVYPCRKENLWKPVRLALGKTFRGMDHAAETAKRCAKLLGA